MTHVADVGLKLSTLAANNGAGAATSAAALAGFTSHVTSNSPADDDYLAGFFMNGEDDNSDEMTFAAIQGRIKDASNGSADGALLLHALVGDSLVQVADFADTAASTWSFADGAYDVDVKSHDGTNGLKLGGTLITSTAAELNIMDGGTSASSTTLADADRIVVNDNGTMKQVALTDLEVYMEASLDTMGSQFTSASSLATVGTITSGTWNATAIGAAYLASGVVDDSSLEFSSADAAPTSVSSGVYNIVLDTATTSYNVSANGTLYSPGGGVYAVAGSDGGGAYNSVGYDSHGGSTVDANTSTKYHRITFASLTPSTSDLALKYFSIVGSTYNIGDGGNGSIQVKASGVTNAMLAGSIADSKLATISTAGKVALSALEIDGGTDIGAALADADLFIVDDGAGGTNRKMTASRLPTYITSGVSDVTVAVGSDSMVIYDATDGTMKRDSLADYASAIAGSGVTASSGVLSVVHREHLFMSDNNGDSNSIDLESGDVKGIFPNTEDAVASSLRVYLNGMLQREGSGYDYINTARSGGTAGYITMSSAIDSDDVIHVHYIAA